MAPIHDGRRLDLTSGTLAIDQSSPAGIARAATTTVAVSTVAAAGSVPGPLRRSQSTLAEVVDRGREPVLCGVQQPGRLVQSPGAF